MSMQRSPFSILFICSLCCSLRLPLLCASNKLFSSRISTHSYRMLHYHHFLARSQIQNDHVNEIDQRLHRIAEIVRKQIERGLGPTIRLPRDFLRADETVVHQREDRLGVHARHHDIQYDTPSRAACRSSPPAAPPASCASATRGRSRNRCSCIASTPHATARQLRR